MISRTEPNEEVIPMQGDFKIADKTQTCVDIQPKSVDIILFCVDIRLKSVDILPKSVDIQWKSVDILKNCPFPLYNHAKKP